MNIWVVMVTLGLLTFLTRLSFIGLFQRWQPPELVGAPCAMCRWQR
jgi:branched-subunit amino acid transport protein